LNFTISLTNTNYTNYLEFFSFSCKFGKFVAAFQSR
jgi:hypothetical protein